MKYTVPTQPKIYHIVHIDKLASILSDGCLWCDAKIARLQTGGTVIGMQHIKNRRMQSTLTSHSGLHVGDCVPFYFCPRSIMLYILNQANHPDISYHGGQANIIHLEADLRTTVEWAIQNHTRWAFTLGNAGSSFFEDRKELEELDEINWPAVHTEQWQSCKDAKQAEFLIEGYFPIHLIEQIGVLSKDMQQKVLAQLQTVSSSIDVQMQPRWYY